jgi:hypothetical protein
MFAGLLWCLKTRTVLCAPNLVRDVGKKGNLSRCVDEALLMRLFELTVTFCVMR